MEKICVEGIEFSKNVYERNLNVFREGLAHSSLSCEKVFEELLDIEEKDKESIVLKDLDNKIDIILSYTCPYKYLPREIFLEGVDQSTVDNSTEYFLDKIEEFK